jgi:hypothetical protein
VGGAGGSSLELWQFLQEGYFGWRLPFEGFDVRIEGGVFLSPIGYEAMSIRDNRMNWSRSNLFYGLPFYHTGIRVLWAPDPAWRLTASVWNGWNSLLDNNTEKSFSVAADYTGDVVRAHLMYFGGVERETGYEGGRPFRHLLDFWIDGHVGWLTLAAQLNGGLEESRFGLGAWAAGAAYARIQPIEWLAFTARGDVFWDGATVDMAGTSQRIFWPNAEWVSSVTGTLALIPEEHITFMLEYRHDEAAGPSYFRGAVTADAPNAASQDTLTLGITAGF